MNWNNPLIFWATQKTNSVNREWNSFLSPSINRCNKSWSFHDLCSSLILGFFVWQIHGPKSQYGICWDRFDKYACVCFHRWNWTDQIRVTFASTLELYFCSSEYYRSFNKFAFIYARDRDNPFEFNVFFIFQLCVCNVYEELALYNPITS